MLFEEQGWVTTAEQPTIPEMTKRQTLAEQSAKSHVESVLQEVVKSTVNVPDEPKKEADLSKIYEEAYFSFVPDVQFGTGFEAALKENIAECGKNKTVDLVVFETPEYVNYMGVHYYPTESRIKDLKKWLIRNGLTAGYELSHSTLNVFAPKKTLKLKIYFSVSVTKTDK